MPRGWGFGTIFLLQGSDFHTFFVPGGGEFALLKNSPGGWSGLELTDTLHVLKKPSPYRVEMDLPFLVYSSA